MRALLLLLPAALAVSAQTVPAPPATPLDPLHFLLGTWTARSTAGSTRAESGGEYTFHTDLNGTVVTRSTTADTCVAPQTFNCQHHDLLTIYSEPGDTNLRAIYFDNEGHVIHYRVFFPDAETAILLSTGPGLQLRLVYHLSQETLSGKFQFAPAGGKTFRSYLEWSGGHPVTHDAANAPFSSSIEALRDSTRILLVFAATSSDPQFAKQFADFKGSERQLMDRSLIMVPVLAHWSPRDASLYEANLPFSVDREQQYLRSRFKVAPGSFTVVLLGKDGGEKTRLNAPISAKSLFETVDSMPMRRLEMKHSGSEPRSR